MAVTILSIGLLIFFGHLLAGFFERTKVPDVLILMLAGIVLGPVLDIVEPEDFGRVGNVFLALALIVILFEGGIHLNVRHLGEAAAETLAISLSTLLVTVMLLGLVADLLLPVDYLTALLISTILSGTSAAVVVPLVRTLRMAPKPSTILFLESALTDVLIIVFAIALGQALATAPSGGASVDGQSLMVSLALSFGVAGAVGIAGAFFWSAVLDRIRQFPNTVFTTFAYVFILFGITELLGYSGAIAALAFGIAVANFPNIPDKYFGKIFSFRLSMFADREKSVFAEAVFLIKTFFFVYLGLSMRFDDWRVVTVGAVLAALAMVARAPIVRLLAPEITARRDAALMSVLIPKGLASAVLATLVVGVGVTDGTIVQGTVYAAIFFSILYCASLVFWIEHGLLEKPAMKAWFGKFAMAAAPAPAEATADRGPDRPVLVLDDILEGLQEPNPIVDLDEKQRGTDGDETDEAREIEGEDGREHL
jgi:NhaP-type Na+/H+ or K+/H+ antiporter